MDPTLVELIKQMPVVAAILWLSREQARERREREEYLAKKEEKDDEAFRVMCHNFQEQITARNEAIWGKMQGVMDECHKLIGALQRQSPQKPRGPQDTQKPPHGS